MNERRSARQGCRVLIVDDNRDAAELVAELLAILGHVTTVAFSAAEGELKARELELDVAFFDLGMPGRDGLALARTFRADPELCSIRLIALTGWGADGDRERSSAAGFRAHLTKPAGAEALLAAIEVAMV